jgi:hypothetical protein
MASKKTQTTTSKPAKGKADKASAAPAAVAVAAELPGEISGEAANLDLPVPAEKLKGKKKDKGADKDKGAVKEKRKDRKSKKKEAVIIRFDDQQLPLIDARADALGLSRAAWVRMVVSQALTQG